MLHTNTGSIQEEKRDGLLTLRLEFKLFHLSVLFSRLLTLSNIHPGAHTSNDRRLFFLRGHHHQDREADGRTGGRGHGHSRLAALQAEDYEPLPAGE